MVSSTGERRRSVTAEVVGVVNISYVHGEAYDIDVRHHRLRVDQPRYLGTDTAPTPVELFVASLASCVAFYAGRYLDRHAYGREGLAARAEFRMAEEEPSRLASIRIHLRVPPEVPPDRIPALRAVASHCTVHNSLLQPPGFDIDVSTAGAHDDR